MFGWTRKAKNRRTRIDVDVGSLMDSAADPYVAARARERDALEETEAKHWSRVAVAIAKRTGKQIGLDVATRMTTDE